MSPAKVKGILADGPATQEISVEFASQSGIGSCPFGNVLHNMIAAFPSFGKYISIRDLESIKRIHSHTSHRVESGRDESKSSKGAKMFPDKLSNALEI